MVKRMPNIEVLFHKGIDEFYLIKYFNEKNELHNENGPAKIMFFSNGQKNYEEYWINGKRHNDKGPAVISYYKSGEICGSAYCLKGKQLTKVQWEKRCQKSQ